MRIKDKVLIGWEEWCEFPKLHLPAIKAKVDTGAKTSCLHADNIRVVKIKGIRFVRFNVHPLQSTDEFAVSCKAPLVDYRYVTNSGGYREKRYVIRTPLSLGEETWPIEVTLTQRYSMRFRMLLGRDAMKSGHLIVDPCKSCVHGAFTFKQVLKLYR